MLGAVSNCGCNAGRNGARLQCGAHGQTQTVGRTDDRKPQRGPAKEGAAAVGPGCKRQLGGCTASCRGHAHAGRPIHCT
eukprot:73184-Lingulodinium_polyedra.AAC.1